MVTGFLTGASADREVGALSMPRNGRRVAEGSRSVVTVQKKLIVGVSASPSDTSTTAMVLDNLLARAAGAHTEVLHIRIRDLSPAALVRADATDPDVSRALQSLDHAAGVIFATPIYKAAYSGLLKLLLDLMPQFGLAGKSVLALGTGGSLAHALALDYGLRPVLQSMGARHVIQSVLVFTESMRQEGGQLSFDESMEATVSEAIHHLHCSILGNTADRLLGHPRPERPVRAG